MRRTLAVATLAFVFAAPAALAQDSRLQADIEAIEQMSTLDADAATLGLGASVERALSDNLGLLVRVRELDAAKSRLQASWSPFMPYVSAGWGYNPNRSESFLDDWETWRHVNGDNANYRVGAGFAMFTGTTFNLNWAQGTAGSLIEFDPEIRIDNPIDPDEPFDILVNRDFRTRWSALSFQLNQNLLEGVWPAYHLRGVRKAQLAIDGAEVARDRQMSDVTASVLKAYWDLVAARRLVEIQRIDKRLAEEQRVAAQARITAGDLAPIELLTIDEQVASSEADLLEAKRLAEEAEQLLKLLIGVDPADELWRKALRPTDGIDIASRLPARDLEASLEVALERNPDIVLARQQLDRDRIDQQAAKHQVLPTLDLNAALSLNGVGFDQEEAVREVFEGKLPDFSVGMEFTMPVPDLGAIYEMQASALTVEAAELSVEAAEREVQGGIESALRSIRSYRSQVEVAEVRVTLAARNAEAAEATYRAGRTTLREVFEAQADLKEARQALVVAQVNELKAAVDLEVLRGTLLQTLGVELR